MQIITITGNLVADAQVKCRKSEDNGFQNEFVTFKVACNTIYGEVKESTFYEVICRKTGIVDYLKKGQAVLVHGNFRLMQSTDDKGIRHTNPHITNASVELFSKRKQEIDNDLPKD